RHQPGLAQVPQAVVQPLGKHQTDEEASPRRFLPHDELAGGFPAARTPTPRLVFEADAAAGALEALGKRTVALRANHGHDAEPFEAMRVIAFHRQAGDRATGCRFSAPARARLAAIPPSGI